MTSEVGAGPAVPPPLPPLPPPLPPGPAAPPAKPPSLAVMVIVDFLLAIGLLLGLSFLFVMPVAAMAMLEAGKEAVGAAGAEAVLAGWMSEMVTAAVLATLTAGVLAWLIRRRSLAGPLPAMPPAPAWGLAVLGGLAVQAFAVIVGMLSHEAGAGLEPSNALPLTDIAERTPWLAWLLVVVAAPLGEELLFRHVLLRRFALAGKAGLGLAITSLGFALMHEPWPGDGGVLAWLSTTSVYVAMGLGFGLVYVRTGRYWAAVLAHAVCNLMAMLLLQLG